MPVTCMYSASLFCTALLLACSLPGQAQDLDTVLRRAQAEQSAGQYSKAATEYAAATVLSPETPELWANRGVMEYMGGNLPASIASLKRALAFNQKLFTPQLFLGKAYLASNQPEQALPYLTRAHASRPDDVQVLITRGKVNQSLHHPAEAATDFEHAVRVDPASTEGWYGLGVASLALIETSGRKLATMQAHSIWARALYADELLEQGRPVEALDTYKSIAATAPSSEKEIVSHTLMHMRSHPEVFPLPAASQAALETALQSLSTSDEPSAECTSIEEQPAGRTYQNIKHLLREAACAYWSGDYSGSAADAERATTLAGQQGQALYWSVKANELRSLAALARFEQIALQSQASYDLVGDLYRHQRELDNALAEYNKALALDAHDPAALLGSAAVFLSQGKLAEAGDAAQSALADLPTDPQLNLLMAEVLVAKNEFVQAEPYLQTSLSGPAEILPRVHALLGRLDAEKGETQEAIHHFEVALSSDRDGSLHYQLSRLYRKVGYVAEAQKAEAEARGLIKQRLANATVAYREATASTP